jgi:hypothetical protein
LTALSVGTQSILGRLVSLLQTRSGC